MSSQKTDTNQDIFQLKLVLMGIKPPIWRRILVSKKTTFYDLHHILQIAMGWDNYHLYQFETEGMCIGLPEYLDEFDEVEMVEAATVALEDVILGTNTKFCYEYDFGDSWRHQIELEKVLPLDSSNQYPFCIAGARRCPPEDCGGIPGYENFIEAINNKRHPEHKSNLTWVGGQYDATYFDKESINAELGSLDEYITEYLKPE